MTRVILLEQLKEFTEEVLKDLLLPVPPPEDTQCAYFDTDFDDGDEDPDEQEENAEQENQDEPYRRVKVFLNALPDEVSATRDAPYILHQALTSKDYQEPGGQPQTTAVVRTVFCVYHKDGQEGGTALLNVMERLRVALLRQCIVGGQFCLDLKAGLETLSYPDTGPPPKGTAPYYLGEMISTWHMQSVKRLDAARAAHGMPPRDPHPRHLKETITLKGNGEHGE